MGHAERGSPLMLWIMREIGLRMGRPVSRLLLYPITIYFLLTAREHKRWSRLYLARVLGRPARWRDSFWHYHTFASTILDRVYLLSDQHHRLDIRLHGVELLEAQVASGRGALLLGSHLGSFEVLRALAVEKLDLPLRILMYPHQNEAITSLLNALNPGIAKTVIELGRADSMIRVGEALSKGCLVGILGDRVTESRKVTHATLLGGPVQLPSAPILLANRLEVPILLFFGLYRGGNRYDVHFESLADRIVLHDDHRAADIQAWMQRFADRIEFHARRAPYNWFNFYDVWHEEAA
jgi:predicted LPLAT superfamily acyltransferase